MAFNISQIKTALKDGGARPTLFKVSSLDTDGKTDRTYHVRSTQLPGSNLGILTTNWRGRPVKFPGVRTFDPWTVTMLNDDGKHRSNIFMWMKRLAGDDDGVRTAFLGPYDTADYVDLSVTQIGKDGNDTYKYELINCFPIALGDIGLDWATEGFQEYTVTWRFDYLKAYQIKTAVKQDNTGSGSGSSKKTVPTAHIGG
jgi:hypothetical protein